MVEKVGVTKEFKSYQDLTVESPIRRQDSIKEFPQPYTYTEPNVEFLSKTQINIRSLRTEVWEIDAAAGDLMEELEKIRKFLGLYQ